MTGPLPFGKFFWSDYASDHALKFCSFAAQGLWMRMLCIAAEHEPVGYVAINGNGLDAQGIARVTGGAADEVEALLAELEQKGVFSRDRRGWIYSRRMIRDAKKARNARENGKKGGNPNLGKQKENRARDNQEDKGRDKPHIPEARDSVDKSTGAQAPDRVKMIYDLGLPALVAAGTRETQARSIIGKWRKDAGDDAIVLSCLSECTRLEIGNPVEWMPKAIARRAPKAEPSFLDHLREKHALDAKLAAGGAR